MPSPCNRPEVRPTRRGVIGLLAAALGLASVTAHARPASRRFTRRSPMTTAPRAQDITDHGALGDGQSDDTAALQAAVDECQAAGGGTVRAPPGLYRIATVRLCSNLTLHLEPGADVFDPEGEAGMRGPHAVLGYNSRDVAIRGVTIRDAANDAMLMLYCDGVDCDGVSVRGGWDGFHIRGSADTPSRRATFTNCRFFTGEDAIAGHYTDDLLVRGCVLNSSCNAIRWLGPGRRMRVDTCLMFGPGRFPHRKAAPDAEVDEPGRGVRGLPVWGLYARRVESLTLDNVTLDCRDNDPRAALRIEDVADFDDAGLRLPT